MAGSVSLPVVDLASPDLRAAAASVRQACVEHGFFYVTNHGVDGSLLEAVFAESKGFFGLPMEEKMKLQRGANHRGYTPPYAEKLDASSQFVGDLKESFYIGPVGDSDLQNDLNQWPSEERFPSWKETMKLYIATVLVTGERILSLIALGLNLDAEFFHKIGAFDCPSTFLRLLHYPGEVNESDSGNYGASAHSDYGVITLLVTDGTPGLQICREKDRSPQLWEDVHHIDGSLIVNIGDLLERWTNCVFSMIDTINCGGRVAVGTAYTHFSAILRRSTLHRVVAVGKERYSVAFFLDPNCDTVVQCLESCCSEANPPRFPPIRSGDYITGRINSTYK